MRMAGADGVIVAVVVIMPVVMSGAARMGMRGMVVMIVRLVGMIVRMVVRQ